MRYFYELTSKQAGYSRLGRIILSKEAKNYISTPEIVIPMKRTLMNHLGFLEEFQEHRLFLLSKEIYLKIGFLREKFKDTGFIFTHYGTLTKFNEILTRNIEKILQNKVICLIPFNIPNTTISKEFAVNEITSYLLQVKNIISRNSSVLFGLSIRVFDYPELIDLYFSFIKENQNVKILNLLDLFDNFKKYRKIIETIVRIKTSLDNNLVLMASGKIIPNQFPFLVYLGIDLINSSYTLYLSSENFYDTIEYLLPIYKVNDFSCSCFACNGELKEIKQDKYSSKKLELLSLHNIISASNLVNKIKQYLKTEDFRNYVEKAVLNDLYLISALKVLDRKYFDILKYETPVTQKNKKINCIGAISYHRPDFRQFREKLIASFTPEPWTRLIILFPCSSKKPYSESKSHKAFQNIMRKFPEFPNFQEIILTSPLGAIPRQLENLYPVNSYDIPVTGAWDAEEIKITADMLKRILEKYDENIPILSYLKGKGYSLVIEKVKKSLNHKFYCSEVTQSLTSKESLKSFFERIEHLKSIYQPKDLSNTTNIVQKSWNRKLSKTFDYQFGRESGFKLLQNNIKVRKNIKANKLEIRQVQTNKLLGTFYFDTGQIEPTLEGLTIFDDLSKIEDYIIFNDEKLTGTTLFRPGVLDLSPELKPGQIVVIFNKYKGKIIGIGRLLVGTNNIKNTTSGKIVDIYEKS